MKLVAKILFILVLFLAPVRVFAQERVNPGDDYRYVIKRLQEKVKLLLITSPVKKISFHSKLIDVRLSELKYVVERKDIANFQTASQRYSATAGQATDFVLKKGSNEAKEKLVEQFKSHIPPLVNLQTPYIPDNSEWRFLQDNINSLESYISRLSE